jgi:hypothetical protein
MNNDGFFTSGKDGFVRQWSKEFLSTGKEIHLPSLINSKQGLIVLNQLQ